MLVHFHFHQIFQPPKWIYVKELFSHCIHKCRVVTCISCVRAACGCDNALRPFSLVVQQKRLVWVQRKKLHLTLFCLFFFHSVLTWRFALVCCEIPPATASCWRAS